MIFSLVSIYDKKINAYSNIQQFKYDKKELQELYSRDLKASIDTDKLEMYQNKVVIYLGDFDDTTGAVVVGVQEKIIDFDEVIVSLKRHQKKDDEKVGELNVPTNEVHES